MQKKLHIGKKVVSLHEKSYKKGITSCPVHIITYHALVPKPVRVKDIIVPASHIIKHMEPNSPPACVE